MRQPDPEPLTVADVDGVTGVLADVPFPPRGQPHHRQRQRHADTDREQGCHADVAIPDLREIGLEQLLDPAVEKRD